MFEKIIRKFKNLVHCHENLKRLILFAWGLFWIVRARLIFRKIRNSSKPGEKRENRAKVIIFSVKAISTTELVYFDAIFGHTSFSFNTYY